MIAVQARGGPSFLGKVWLAEAEAPTRPWWRARKIVTHDKCRFCSPVSLPVLRSGRRRMVRCKRTRSQTFCGPACPTPRYDYNQLMHRLDLAGPRLPNPLAP